MTIKRPTLLDGARAVSLGLAKTAAQKAPGISQLGALLANIEASHRAQRLETLSSYLNCDEDGVDFARTLEDALLGPERALVLSAVRASARAAVDAIDDIAVPTIALLTRLYVLTRTPDRVVYEELLRILESIERDVFVALDGVFTTVSQIFDDTGFVDMATTFRYEADVDDLAWKAWHPRDAPTAPGEQVTHSLLLQGDLARRAVSTLLGGHRGTFQRNTWPLKPKNQRPGERRVSRTMSAGDQPLPDFRAEMISLMRSIWYVPA